MSPDDLTRIHERLDALLAEVGEIKQALAEIRTNCGPCREMVTKHERTLYGNGALGLTGRLYAVEQGRVDTLTIRGVCIVIGAVGSLAGAIGAAIATVIK